MKYQNKLDKKNIIYIIIVVLISILTLIGILYLEQYLFAIIFIIIILLLLYTYIHTIYELSEDYFIVRYGFIKIKFKYDSIKNINLLNDKIYLKIGISDFIMNVDNPQKVVVELKKRSN